MPRRNHKNKIPKHIPFVLSGSNSNTCQTKQAYATEFEAQQAIKRSQQYNPDTKLKSYFCPHCQKYHLTRKKS